MTYSTRRRQFAVALGAVVAVVAAAGAALAASAFNDVTDNHPASAEITAAHQVGVFQGYGDGTFRPDGKLTRGQAELVIHRMLTWQGTDDDGNFEISRADAAVLAMSGLCGLDPDRIPACAAVAAASEAEVQAAYNRGYDDGFDAATPTGSTPPPVTVPSVPPELSQRQFLQDLTGVHYSIECLKRMYQLKTRNENNRGVLGSDLYVKRKWSPWSGAEYYQIDRAYLHEPVFIPHLFPDKTHPIHGSNDPGYGYADRLGHVCTHLHITTDYHPNAPTLDRADAQLTTMCLLTYSWPYGGHGGVSNGSVIRVLEPERISLEGTAAAAAIRARNSTELLDPRGQDFDAEDCLTNGISVEYYPHRGAVKGGWVVVEPREPWTADPRTYRAPYTPHRCWVTWPVRGTCK